MFSLNYLFFYHLLLIIHANIRIEGGMSHHQNA